MEVDTRQHVDPVALDVLTTANLPELPEEEHRKDSGIGGVEKITGKMDDVRETVTHLPSPTLSSNEPKPQVDSPVSQATTNQATHVNGDNVEQLPGPELSADGRSDTDPPSDAPVPNEPEAPAAKETLPEEPVKARSRSGTKSSHTSHTSHDGKRRLSATKIQELTTAPGSLPVAAIPDKPSQPAQAPLTAGLVETRSRPTITSHIRRIPSGPALLSGDQLQSDGTNPRVLHHGRPNTSSRTLSTPPTSRRKSTSQPPTQPTSTRRNSFHPSPRPPPLELDRSNFPAAAPAPKPAGSAGPALQEPIEIDTNVQSPMPPTVPLPPMSIPTVLQLELAGQRPSPLYIYQSYAGEQPYESSAVKFERLKNFLVLPAYLERTMNFGALACLDAWLWTFTILPMRFCIAVGVLARWWAYMMGKEVRWLVGFVWYGLGRLWQRGRRGRPLSRASSYASSVGSRSRSRSAVRDVPNGGLANSRSASATGVGLTSLADLHARRFESLKLNGTGSNGATAPKQSHHHRPSGVHRHRRTKSTPSNLTSIHKADLLQMVLIILSSIALLKLDASRMYHFIRAQSQIKLYVIFNLLEVGDRLLSAVGQDILECLFSSETLSRNSSGRSKVVLPLGMFLLALVYNIFHAAVLFYQVITLNVAVNSYSHALLSLLMSNQFVEVKSAVFKRFEKENSFQLTCADIVERFQLWIMLLIIGLRNVVEVGGLSVPGAGSEMGGEDGTSTMPIHSASILPASFTILPSWLWSGEVLSPFLIVIGSETIVDWVKHAFINKFNNIKPNFYSRILDILCKDYYTNAFVTPSLTRRLGLPLIPLSCLFIRASVQTYHMFIATHVPSPLPPSTQTSLSVESAVPSPAIAAAFDKLDNIIRNALGRAVYGYPYASADGSAPENLTAADGGAASNLFGTAFGRLPRTVLGWTSDDAIAALTMLIVFLLVFLVLLVVKLVLGMVLLRYSRDRYARMKAAEAAVAAGRQERDVFDAQGKRVGGFGHVEVGEDRRRWIYADDQDGLRKAREKERRDEEKRGKERDWGGVQRYEMIAKRIW